ncbi:DUF2917 domain-containing protein [Paraburkholderia caballeronis]|uniref:DUF2917 domain-containing protein n=1 Tax=Paraburkholderia caballeronis TaxID=416943 RepID=UPI0010668AAB|nr:DUF2917 domain-containing protein [Paraburkholderia caballeronis]TDV08279.1 hypothetical protein C7408_11744 [Paraburkholderia caballeronis]TDV11971.1 hypothetical protein C7406_11844 [Paraburkholderia caballeronis]TDV22592.1 hypothetical protein C7404_11744 [Paraburkholderia caballeronis]
MREIRIFELAHDEPAQLWRPAQPLRLQVSEGELWLTIEGDAGDYWLRNGESFALPARAKVWVSAGRAGARFLLALGGASASARAAAIGERHAARAFATAGWTGRWPWSSRAA